MVLVLDVVHSNNNNNNRHRSVGVGSSLLYSADKAQGIDMTQGMFTL